MRLADALEGVAIRETACFDPDLEVDSVTIDSRQAHPGAVFVAVPGFKQDGARFIPAAIAAGSRVILTAALPVEQTPGITYLAVDDVRATIAPISRNIYGRADERMRMLGVTGTNGKTTVAYFTAEILRAHKRRVGIMGTIGFDIDGEIIETPNTTPEAPLLHSLLRDAADAGVDDVIMEVSSHSLELHRADGIPFAVTMFTNLTEDHLELHGDMEHYFAAKRKLFELAPESVAVIDIDGPWGRRLADEREAAGSPVLRTSAADPMAGLRAEHVRMSILCTEFELVYQDARRPVRLHWLGDYNVRNALTAAGAALSLGYSLDETVAGLEAAKPVTGRLEPIANDDDLAIIIDYAHTTDALAACLRAVRALSDRPITLVHGVLGDRVHALRHEMGVIAAHGADHVIFTEDDLKADTLEGVLADVAPALDAGPATWELIENRWDAIGAGVERARRGDILVVAGKGHERQLILGDGAGFIYLNEHDAVAEALAGRDPRALDPRG